MIAQHAAKRGVQDMRRGVVAGDAGAARTVDRRGDLVAHSDGVGRDLHLVAHKSLLRSLRVEHVRLGVGAAKRTGIADLAAHLGVEGGRVEHDFAFFTCGKFVSALAVRNDGDHLRRAFKLVVTHELRGTDFLQHVGMNTAVGAPSRLGVLRVGGAGTLALLVHATLEALHVDLHVAVGAHLLGHLDGETVGVVQGERFLARKRVALELVERLREKDLALAQRGAEALFLGEDHAANELAVFHDLGIHRAHELHDLVDVVVQERPFDADHVRLLDGATK